MRYLDIGAGGLPFRPDDPQWTHQDIRKCEHIEVFSDSRAIPLPDESFDGIRTSHHLEHIEYKTVPKALKEWYRLLKPDGWLEIIIPNFDIHLAGLVQSTIDNRQSAIDWHMGYLYGGQNYAEDYHKVALPRQYLRRLLNRVGFKHIEDLPSDEIHVRAWKAYNDKSIRIAVCQNRQVSRIKGRGFFIVNTSGWGDILATTCAIHELKRRGAAWVVLGSRLWEDFSLIRANQDIEYLFLAERREGGREIVADRLAKWYYDRADYHIYQSHYEDTAPFDFYESRLEDVGVESMTVETVKPHIDLAGHVIPDLREKWFPQWGIKEGEYIVLHHQASHQTRCWHMSEVYEFCMLCKAHDMPLVVVGQSSPVDIDGVLNLTHQFAFDAGAGVMSLAKAAVCTDSVFSHIAHAFDIPQVCLYSDAPPELRLEVHAKRIRCLKGRAGQVDGIADITARQVFEALHE